MTENIIYILGILAIIYVITPIVLIVLFSIFMAPIHHLREKQNKQQCPEINEALLIKAKAEITFTQKTAYKAWRPFNKFYYSFIADLKREEWEQYIFILDQFYKN